MQNCLWELWLYLALNNINLIARPVEGSVNSFADALSHFHLGPEFKSRVSSILTKQDLCEKALSEDIFIFTFNYAFFPLFFADERSALTTYQHQLPMFAFQDSTKKTVCINLRAFHLFCTHFSLPFYPVTKETYMAYLAFLSRSLSFTSVRNYLSILSQINKSLGYSCAFLGDYDSQLGIRAVRRLLGDVTARKHVMTVDILLQILPHLVSGNIFHTCMAVLFLVIFFSFLRISNLVPCMLRDISNPHPLFLKRSDVHFSPRGAVLSVARRKTLQFNQRLLEIPLPIIPGSPLCPISALRLYLHHIPAEPYLPLFSLYVNNQYRPI